MYREPQSSPYERNLDEQPGFFTSLFAGAFHLLYFTLLPIFLQVIISWAVYTLTVNNFYQESWMMPLLLGVSTFLAGALIRQKMEDEGGGMGYFALGILALLAFTWLTHYDIEHIGGVYSRFLPKFLKASMLDYIFLLPGVGLGGMIGYKYFTSKI